MTAWRSATDLFEAQTQREIGSAREGRAERIRVYECGVGACPYTSLQESEIRVHRGRLHRMLGARLPSGPITDPVPSGRRLSPRARAERNAEIRRRFAGGESRFELAEAFGLTWTWIDRIVGRPRERGDV